MARSRSNGLPGPAHWRIMPGSGDTRSRYVPPPGRPARADVLLTRADERSYVAVCGADPQPAWEKLVDKDGALGLCAPTRQVRNDLVAAAKAAGVGPRPGDRPGAAALGRRSRRAVGGKLVTGISGQGAGVSEQ